MKEDSQSPLNDQIQGGGGQARDQMSISSSSHSFACIFTFAFKAAAFLIYFIIGNFFADVNTFIIVVILSALDFWTVKNVTGRLLVGLRWWHDFDDSGKEVWKFDSYNKEFKPSAVDSTFFWGSQMASTGTWTVFLGLNLLSLSFFWAVLCVINLGLSLINLLGYYKCKGEHNKKMDVLKKNMLAKGFTTFFTGK